MADETLTLSLLLLSLVLVAFAWMVMSARSLKNRGEHRSRELRERALSLERRANDLQQGIHELKAQAERKAEQAYVEKRINGLVALVKGGGGRSE